VKFERKYMSIVQNKKAVSLRKQLDYQNVFLVKHIPQ